jgi:hypothetical protein
MPINIPSAFNVGASVPIDTRLVLTKAQMKATNDNVMPSVYFTLCSDDNAFYLYSKNNTIDDTTGKFRYMFDQEGPSAAQDEHIEELIAENAASKEDMQEALNQLAEITTSLNGVKTTVDNITAGAPEDCDTFAEVAAKFDNTPDTTITDDEISNIFG